MRDSCKILYMAAIITCDLEEKLKYLYIFRITCDVE